MAPDLVREFVEAFQKETNRVAAEREQAEELATARLGAIARKIAALVSAIENGKYSPALSSRLAALENEKADLLVEMAQGPAPSIVRLHPAIADVYAAKVARQMSSCVRSSNESNLVLVKKDSQCGPCLLATSRGSLLSAKQPQKTRTAPRRRPGAVPVDGGCGDSIAPLPNPPQLAAVTLQNSTMAPSAVHLTIRPRCSPIVGSIRSLRSAEDARTAAPVQQCRRSRPNINRAGFSRIKC